MLRNLLILSITPRQKKHKNRMKFEVTILGSSSATPTLNRNPTAQLLNYSDQLYLIDCGEGTQMRLNHLGIKKAKINHIFISHLHGDHYLGLIGLLSSLHLAGRQMPMHLFGPAPLKEIIDIQLKHSKTRLQYELIFKATDPKNPLLLYENENLLVKSFPLRHKIDTTGFIFKEKPRPRKIDGHMVDEMKVPLDYRPLLKKGLDYIDKHGNTIPNKELTIDPEKSRSYAFCSDTSYYEPVIENVMGCDLLYHEATFMEDMRERAKLTRHSTAKDAASIAKQAQVEQLLIGHFSARYKDFNPLLNEAKEVFPNTLVAEEGQSFPIGWQ